MLNEPLQCKRYKSILLSMMSYKYGIIYGKDYEFSDEQLSEIQPDDIYKWMALKVFGQPDPSHDDNPTLGCSTSLEYYKKAISFFMPNRLATWNVLNKLGNPTRSQIIIDLIKAVRKKEVCKLGKPSAARCPLQFEEFSNTIAILHTYPDSIHRYEMSALCAFQSHMVG